MSVTGLGLAASAGDEGSNSFRIHASDGSPAAPLLVWRTLTGPEWLASFDVAVSYRGVPTGRSGTGESSYGYWSDWFYERVPVSGCSGVQGDDGLWSWSLPLDVAGLASELAPDGWAYGDRAWDELDLQLKVKGVYLEGKVDEFGRSVSEVTYAESFVGWFPEYSATGAAVEPGGALRIDLSRPGWERTDDRWEVTSVAQGGRELLRESVWGDVGAGSALVPASALTAVPAAGTADVAMRVNAAYKPIGWSLADVSGPVEVRDESTANTPALAARAEGLAAVVSVSDSGDRGVPLESVTVRLDGGGYAFDAATVEPGGAATFPFPPLDVPLTFSAVGEAGNGAVSRAASCSLGCVPSGGACAVDSADGSARVSVTCNPQASVSRNREKTVEKLAGRSRPSAWYGTGCTANGTLSGELEAPADCGEDGTGALDALALAGPCVVRLPNGYRSLAALGDVSWSRSSGRKVTASIAWEEVAE